MLIATVKSAAPECRWIVPSGLALFVLGFFGRVWASGFLVKNDALTTVGPYGYVRNPIYVSNMLLGLGIVFLNGRYWTLAILIAVYAVCYVPGMRVESENLRRRYGSAFDSYEAAVPLIVPRCRLAPGFGGGCWTIQAYIGNREIWVTIGLLIGLGVIVFKRIISP